MANKKTKEKQKKLKKRPSNKASAGKQTAAKKLAKKKVTAKKVSSKRKPSVKKVSARKKAVDKKVAGKKTAVAKSAATLGNAAALTKKSVPALRRGIPTRSRDVDPEPFRLQPAGSRVAGQSGDLQGLSDVESADSESVDELIEEGNAFEAGVVAGVERADDDNGEKEVRTREVPEDDVPGEYLDEE